MLEVNKYKTEFGYAFDVSTEEGIFTIYFAGNLDLYFSPKYFFEEEENIKKFTITKENYHFYKILEQLYEDIKKCEVYKEC